jgi:voltage-gated potassium channel
MAGLALRPNVVDALDIVLTGTASPVRIEEMVVGAAAGQLSAGDLRHSGATLLALGSAQGELIVGPKDDQLLCANDLVVAMGSRDQLLTLAQALGPRNSVR